MSSVSEQEIREAVVSRLRDLTPQARIVHELNVAGQGSNRVDVAAIGSDFIIAVEIKSERDTLSRLDKQIQAFEAIADVLIVAAHAKHWHVPEKENRHRRKDILPVLEINHPACAGYRRRECSWHYPQEGLLETVYWTNPVTTRVIPWSLSKFHPDHPRPPHATALLEMLWRDELAMECARHGIIGKNRNRPDMIYDMAMMMTGREVKIAVCRQLRMREFASADAPLLVSA